MSTVSANCDNALLEDEALSMLDFGIVPSNVRKRAAEEVEPSTKTVEEETIPEYKEQRVTFIPMLRKISKEISMAAFFVVLLLALNMLANPGLTLGQVVEQLGSGIATSFGIS